jgi:hypothetical protein
MARGPDRSLIISVAQQERASDEVSCVGDGQGPPTVYCAQVFSSLRKVPCAAVQLGRVRSHLQSSDSSPNFAVPS